MAKFRFIEINYHHHAEFNLPEQVIARHLPSNLYLAEFAQHAEVTLVKHLGFEGTMTNGALNYAFFKSKNAFFHVPRKTHRYIRQMAPDVVLVQGFIFPWQVIALRRTLGRKPIILLQHHGEVPFRRKKIFQWFMSSRVDGWLFSSKENAGEWIKAGIINERQPCFAIPPASNPFIRRNKSEARRQLQLPGELCFLWVGRLNENKDPFTLLDAFDRYLQLGGSGKLYMLFTEAELEGRVREMISSRERLTDHVNLIGKVSYDRMENWYNACDFLVSSSRREGGSYAIMEALACGCVPIVSAIPASMELIGHGAAGFHFSPGDSRELAELMLSLPVKANSLLSEKAVSHFQNEMSPSAISSKMLSICSVLLSKQSHH